LLGRSIPRSPSRSPALWAALCVYTVLSVTTLRQVGLVGEIASAWTAGAPGQVMVATDPLRWSDGERASTVGHRWGPLVASQTRPIETIQLGPWRMPLAINQYTGGLPDWPARAVFGLTGSITAVLALHGGLGALLIVCVHRFLWFHGTRIAAGVAALLLATDWGFLFYRRALGGTELVLLAAGVLCLWALWSRRWAGGPHGLWAFGLGVGLGCMAKLTFVVTLAALAVTAVILRKDKPAMRPPLPARPMLGAFIASVCLTPLVIAAIHHGFAIDATGHIKSHDFVGFQWSRVWGAMTGGPTPARESIAALWAWVGDPSAFLKVAYGVKTPNNTDALRLLGWMPVLAGVGMAWRARHPTPHEALLRFSSLFLVLQVGGLWWVARDLHHLAQATPTAVIVAALAFDRLAGRVSPPRSFARTRASYTLSLAWVVAGVLALVRTDPVLAQVARPSVTRDGQTALVEMITRNQVRRLTACDYELAGVLEPLLPGVDIVQAWGLASHDRGAAKSSMLEYAVGGHLLSVPDAPPWSYNLRLHPQDISTAATQVGVAVEVVDQLPDGAAVLYTVRRR
jgi:4-amino-4-deoxy-L-arabinose transferase-like glycosyltransferase